MITHIQAVNPPQTYLSCLIIAIVGFLERFEFLFTGHFQFKMYYYSLY